MVGLFGLFLSEHKAASVFSVTTTTILKQPHFGKSGLLLKFVKVHFVKYNLYFLKVNAYVSLKVLWNLPSASCIHLSHWLIFPLF